MYRGANKRPANRHTGKDKGKQRQKVGTDPKAVEKVGGSGDFGVAAGDSTKQAQRVTAADEIKKRDKTVGGHPARSGSGGTRVSGAGGNESGPGASSGGDVDTDIVGVGTGGSGVSQSGPTNGPSRSDAGSTTAPTSRPAKDHGDKLRSALPGQDDRRDMQADEPDRSLLRGEEGGDELGGFNQIRT